MTDTLAQPAEHELIVQRSRFRAIAVPSEDPDAALAALQAHSISDASHNCWAYRIGNEYRFNDDGEPGGTAGRPILAAIDGQGFDRVAVLVVRWFGGIKLGAGGLVRAYGGCAAECLRTASRRPLIDHTRLRCAIDFALEQSVRNALPEYGADIVEQNYRADGLHLSLRVPANQATRLREQLTNVCRGRIDFPS